MSRNVNVSKTTVAQESATLEEMKTVRRKPQISDFILKETIGFGNFGKVVLAFNTLTNTECALKIIRKDSILKMKHADHLISELQILTML